jgi:hypothetical protein
MKLLIVVLMAGLVAGCNRGPTDAEITHCVDNGIAYFKEIGSYPTLNSAPNKGRSAVDVAFERCRRGVHAFPEMQRAQ